MKDLAKPLNRVRMNKIKKVMNKLGESTLGVVELQKLVYQATGDKPFDVIPPVAGAKEHAEAVGKKLCDVERNQELSRLEVAEFRQRYERDCELLGFKPVRVWETASPSSVPASDPGAASPAPTSTDVSSVPPDSASSEQSVQQPT